jgi:hypothetical protein
LEKVAALIDNLRMLKWYLGVRDKVIGDRTQCQNVQPNQGCAVHVSNASYRKTLIASSVAGATVVATTCAGGRYVSEHLPPSIALPLLAAALFVGALLILVGLASVLVGLRDTKRQRGEPDLFVAANSARSEIALRRPAVRSPVAFPKLRRWLGAPAFIVGDAVRIRSFDEIALTLDPSGCLDGLPFMPEMAKFCGAVGTVFRCVDKVYDYGGKKDLRRLKDAVLVTGLRCDGGSHDGCQAGCYMLWKTAWLTRADGPAASPTGRLNPSNVIAANRTNVPFARTHNEAAELPDRQYMCQYTELVRASDKMGSWDPRQDLRPLIAGNLTMAAFGLAMMTRLFNAAQSLRGGTGYPPTKTSSRATSLSASLSLQPGEIVHVASPDKIFETLNATGRNFGLTFDKEMLKFCGLRYRVLRRVDKIIDDASGRMLRMKTPCIVLDATDSTGEYLRCCAQHDPAFWREAWLERVEDAPPPAAAATGGTSGRPAVRITSA